MPCCLILFIKRISCCFLICWLVGCDTYKLPEPKIITAQPTDREEALHYLKNGDLLLRSDEDIVGLSLRNMNDSDKTYSHSGLAFYEDSSWYVYHMMAGGENPSMEMRRDSLAIFINRERKSGYGIYRYKLDGQETEALHQMVRNQFRAKLKFDSAFDLADNKTMYCSEMISNNLRAVTKGRIQLSTTRKSNFSFKAKDGGRQPKRDVEYIAIDNLYLNRWCMLVFSKQYK